MLGRASAPILVISFGLSMSCHEGGSSSVVQDDTTASDTVFVPNDGAGEVDGGGDTISEAPLCATEGGFGCGCTGNIDCLDELCIEGPDGNFCTKSCVAECPVGYACLNTSLGGPDPISICVPQHTRLCRPCTLPSDCQSPLDPAPAACVPGDDPEDGSFCATSCAQNACPEGFECEDVTIGDALAKLCRPIDGACECRPAWAELGFVTACARTNEHGTCRGMRACDDDGLSACSALVPMGEVCDLQDEDCDGVIDNVTPEPCPIENDFGTCPGTTACDAAGQEICTGREPSVERCNAIDDDCDGATDEAWGDCPAGGCFLSGGGYVAAGAPSCVEGRCVNPNPVSCGFFTCALGGEEGDSCATSCVDDTTCIPEAHCADGVCVPDIAGGEPCAEDVECATGHCQNGFCCAEGDCCQQPDDCPASYTSAPICDVPATCQGTRREARCVAATCMASNPIDDDSACTSSTQALDCSPALPRFCTGALDQSAPACPSGCESDVECAQGFHCDGTCVPDIGIGGACDEPSDCANGVCADGVCCNEACAGTCRACDVAGSVGTCRNVPANEDPDQECGGVACTGYYFGFVDKTCYLRAAVDDAGATCDGDGACEVVASLCSTAARGEASVTCHADCQEPMAGSCAGTAPGGCSNVSGGTQTCGEGACQVTINRCEGGEYKECVPHEPSPEICDGIDNDCDGLTDAEDDDLVLAPCENQHGVCSGAKHPAELCVGGMWLECGAEVYVAHSPAYEHGQEESCETTVVQFGLDNDCDGVIDDDFTYTSPAGTTIEGAAKPCGVGVCAGGITVCGPLGLVCSNDFKIDTEVCDGLDNDCDGLIDSLDTNTSPLVRVPCEDQDGVCAGAMKPNSLCAAGQWQPCTAESYAAHSSTYEATETTCDGLDNDCDDDVDEGLTGPLNPIQVGMCANTRQRCDGEDGWVDNYPTTFGQDETPDGLFLDENCDGIDGDVDLGLFAAANGSGTTCSMGAPCALATAISQISAGKPHIYLRAGTYGLLNITTSNVRIYGGYGADWVRRSWTDVNHRTSFTGGLHSNEPMGIRVANASGVVLDNLWVRSPDATTRTGKNGRSSYGIYATQATLTISNSSVIGGRGYDGDVGTNGTSASASSAANGTKGNDVFEATNCCNFNRPAGGPAGTNSCSGDINPDGGGGGRGGSADTSGGCICGTSASSGEAGGYAGAWWPDGGGIGTPGAGGGTCGGSTPAPSGRSGRNGADGGAGSAGSSYSIATSYWVGGGGGNGTLGGHGSGGGGGGGSGGCDTGDDSSGAGGGGGGAGGCRAPTVGQGGGGGGGSFGVFALSSNLTILGSTIERGYGGRGGNGGTGGTGQNGGSGGPGGNNSVDTQSAKGGSGGNGGRGGHSGGGGGGGGGYSYNIFRSGGNLTVTDLVYAPAGNVDTSGGGGTGGTGSVPGTNGVKGLFGTLRE